jgi:GxxExxY protein
MAGLVYEQESYEIRGAWFEVYRRMGRGFLEAVYQECLELEFAERGIPFAPKQKLPIVYKGRRLEQFYEADFFCYDKIIGEVKAVAHLADEHRAQVFNYLRATGMKLGLIVNFGSHPELETGRIVL